MQHDLGSIEAIPFGEGREFSVSGRQLAVFRLRSGEVYATQAECPHNGAPLCDGLTGGTTVICPFHAWKFDLRTGEPIMGNCALTTYPVEVAENGTIHVTVADSAVV